MGGLDKQHGEILHQQTPLFNDTQQHHQTLQQPYTACGRAAARVGINCSVFATSCAQTRDARWAARAGSRQSPGLVAGTKDRLIDCRNQTTAFSQSLPACSFVYKNAPSFLHACFLFSTDELLVVYKTLVCKNSPFCAALGPLPGARDREAATESFEFSWVQ